MVAADKPPVGEHLDDLATLPAEVISDLRRVVSTGRSISDRRLALRPSGTGPVRHIIANYFPISAGYDQPAGAGLMWSDVTAAEMAADERAQLALDATAAQQRLGLLSSTSAVLMGSTDLDRLLDRLARVLAPAACDWCVVELIGKSGRIEHVAVSHGDRSAAHDLATALRDAASGATAGSPIASARRTGQAQLLGVGTLGDLCGDPSFSQAHSRLAAVRHTSAIVVPIRNRGTFIGVLILANTSTVPLSDDDLDVAVEIAHRTSLALDRAITYQNEHDLAEQLQQALLPGQIPRASDSP
jgi:transcriptional regulator with GAF, ATPase, and Fis domain